jgi:hypothetical protein
MRWVVSYRRNHHLPGAPFSPSFLNNFNDNSGLDHFSGPLLGPLVQFVREATADQRVSLQSRNGMRSAHLVAAIKMMSENLEYPISPTEIAAQIGISALSD